MELFLLQLVVTTILLLVVARIIPGIEVQGLGSAVVAALVFGLLNAFLKPLLVLLGLPFIILTLGLFYFVINALLLKLVGAVVKGFDVDGFVPALLGSLLLSLLNLLLLGMGGWL